MIRARAAFALAMPVLGGGCVAAAIPVVAGGMIAREKMSGPDDVRSQQREGDRRAGAAISDAGSAGDLATPQARGAMRAAESTTTGDIVSRPPPRPSPDAGTSAAGELATPQARAAMRAAETAATPEVISGPLPPPSSGGGAQAAQSLQGFQALWQHLSAQADRRKRGEPVRSVVLAADARLDAPGFASCGDKPLAVLFDLDESRDSATDPDARWRRWRGDGTDALVAVPGAVEGVEAARREGVAALFVSARSSDSAAVVVATLSRLGFGTLEPGRTLFLRGGDAPADATRQAVAASHCVIALVGDELGDFSALLDAAGGDDGSNAATQTMVAPLWGAGWFLLPNPVRSTVARATNPPEE